ncbi:unnamed protein product [Rhizoctonia solani]|uniref:Jacalin-type lectin domain-containing protein n=1 Tax=Rhizoctonia solani TaxID=456999 RepID=A0A8H3C6D7_9AGAM|nr:unnamed protein product [Rhizoctonia solani]
MSKQIGSKPAAGVPPLLSNDAAHKMLGDLKFFCAVSFHGMNGPYTSSRQAAQVRSNVFNSVRPSQDISTEEYYPADELDARNTHAGWPTLGALPGRPWDIMNQDTKASTAGNWVSRRMVVHRYTVSLRPEDLEPSRAFVKEVEDALEQPSFAERMQALRRTCAVWGEMMPMDAVIGASLAATGTLGPNQNLTGSSATFRPDNRGPDVMQMIDKCLDITNNFEKRFESRVQPVWRGDVTDELHRRTAVTHTGFYAMAGGTTFNDYGYLGDPSTARITEIRYSTRTDLHIYAFQVVYSSDRGGRSLDQVTPIRGTRGDAGTQGIWKLGKDEFIKEVRVKRDASWVGNLEFVTDKNNTRKIGIDQGSLVVMKPPQEDMVLYYIMGRSAGAVQWLSFVWGTRPV